MEHPLSQFKYCPKCGSAHFEVHNEKSKQCADCGFVYYFNPSSATVALILNECDELLVCRRARGIPAMFVVRSGFYEITYLLWLFGLSCAGNATDAQQA